jgi:chromosome segregation ATPase
MDGSRRTRTTVLVTLAAVFVAVGVCAADAGKPAELQRALEDIRRAEQGVRTRISQAVELRTRLRQEGEGLKAEIRDEQRRRAIQSYPDALQIRRVDYNLRLMQRLNGYVEQIDARVADLQTFAACFERHREQIRDESRLLRTLKDADISQLLRQVAATVEQAAARCAAPLIVVPAAQRPMEAVWADVVQSR